MKIFSLVNWIHYSGEVLCDHNAHLKQYITHIIKAAKADMYGGAARSGAASANAPRRVGPSMKVISRKTALILNVDTAMKLLNGFRVCLSDTTKVINNVLQVLQQVYL